MGWGRIHKGDKGLRVEDAKITDEEAWTRIQSGDLKGFSIGGLIYSATCSVCNSDYVDCNHIAGRKYDGMKCGVRIDGIDLAEISIVKDPVQPLAKIQKRETKKTPE